MLYGMLADASTSRETIVKMSGNFGADHNYFSSRHPPYQYLLLYIFPVHRLSTKVAAIRMMKTHGL
jgi:hypothetical protein